MARTGLIVGVLAGWRRQMTPGGCILRLEITERRDQPDDGDFRRVDIALDDRQIRSLARDLLRTANRRGIDLSDEAGVIARQGVVTRLLGRASQLN